MPRAESMPGRTHPAEVIHSVFERPASREENASEIDAALPRQGAGVTVMVLFSVLDSFWPIALAMVRVRSLTLRVMPPSTSKVVRASSDSAIDLTSLSIC